MTNQTIKANVDPKLRQAIRKALKRCGMPAGELADELVYQGFRYAAIEEGIKLMLYARELATGWPMSRFDSDCIVASSTLHRPHHGGRCAAE